MLWSATKKTRKKSKWIKDDILRRSYCKNDQHKDDKELKIETCGGSNYLNSLTSQKIDADGELLNLISSIIF